MAEPLQQRRERILRFLARRAGLGEPPPSVREVAVAAGVRSSQTAYHHLRRLEEEGYVRREGGQSMVGARIEDGDLLVIEEDEDPPAGTVVVALLREGEEVTVKRLYRDGERVRLRPENGDHEELVLPAEEVRVQGRVVYVVHPPGKRAKGGGG